MRRLRPIATALATLVLCLSAGPAAADTTVSLSFDDGVSDGLAAANVLADHGMHGSFFIVTGRVGTAGHLSWDQIGSIYTSGNEIGGHTVSHADLPTLPPDQQRAEICDARQTLVEHGYPQLSFAYPFGHLDPALESLPAECGYIAARASGGMNDSPAESIPPLDRWAIRTRNSVKNTDDVAALERSVLAAEAVPGGWLNIVFHRICDPPSGPPCTEFSMSLSNLDEFLDWLQPRELIGTRVRTIGEVSLANPQPLMSLVGFRLRRNGTARLTAYAGRSGLLEVSDVGRGVAITAKRRRLIKPVRFEVAGAGRVTCTLRPSQAGRRLLRKNGRLATTVRVTFTAFRGTSLSQTATAKLRRPRRR